MPSGFRTDIEPKAKLPEVISTKESTDLFKVGTIAVRDVKN